MARVIGGVNGTVSGKVGNVIYYSSNGGDYIRSLPERKRNLPPTPKQIRQRARFAAVQQWLKPIIPLIRTGFRDYAPRQTPHNSAMSYNLQHALIAEGEGFEVNPEAFAFSIGLLPGVAEARMVQDGDKVHFHWEVDDNISFKNELDRSMLLLYRPGSEVSKFLIYGNERIQLTDSLCIRGFNPGDICHGYLAFISAEDQQVSNSVYLGVLEVQEF